MSTQINAYIPLLDGINYTQWVMSMKAFLMAQNLWEYVDGTKVSPYVKQNLVDDKGNTKTDKDGNPIFKWVPDTALWPKWQKYKNMALGNIMLRVNPSIQQTILRSY